jgi:predicted TIM-barrel fold metal-dependent hydrolase
MQQTVDDFLNLGFKDEVMDSVLYKNAERLLKLN